MVAAVEPPADELVPPPHAASTSAATAATGTKRERGRRVGSVTWTPPVTAHHNYLLHVVILGWAPTRRVSGRVEITPSSFSAATTQNARWELESIETVGPSQDVRRSELGHHARLEQEPLAALDLKPSGRDRLLGASSEVTATREPRPDRVVALLAANPFRVV